jgi:hypothetical protein
MRLVQLGLIAAVGMALFATSGRAAIITFEDVAVAAGTDSTDGDILSGGFTFDSLTNHSHRSNNTLVGGVANGTTLYATDNFLNPTTTTMHVGGGIFTLNSFEIGEHIFAANGSASAVTVTGNLFGGGTISTVVNLDGTFNGPAAPNDLQLVTVNWTNLVSVTFQATAGAGDLGFSLDNITVNEASAVPEPSTLAIFSLGALGIAAGGLRRAQRKSR